MSEDDRDSSHKPQSGVKRVLGPVRPLVHAEAEPAENASLQQFLEREARMKDASQKSGGMASSTSSVSRPDWMLAPPSAQNLSEAMQSDPSAALKGRGFSQASLRRVQWKPSGSTTSENTSSLWTETPAEREKRLRDEELGIRTKASMAPASDSGQNDEIQRDIQRDEQISKAIQAHNATRGPSLLEQHQAQRRSDLQDKRKSKTDRHHESRRRRSVSVSSESDSERDRHRRRSRRDNSPESVSSKDRSHRHHRRRHEDDKHRHRHQKHRHHRHSSSRNRSRSPETERRSRRKDEEKAGSKGGAPMMVWDRDAALSVGGRLMSEKKRTDAIKSAAGLSDRFGNSGTSSKFL